jgi:hypothetical protein
MKCLPESLQKLRLPMGDEGSKQLIWWRKKRTEWTPRWTKTSSIETSYHILLEVFLGQGDRMVEYGLESKIMAVLLEQTKHESF